MTQIFANRAELMPAGETTQEHKKWQEEETALIEKDRANPGLKGGLFRGCFRLTRRRPIAVIRDDEDGVDRCPRCTWELEDGLCASCGYPEGEDSADMSDSDGHGHLDADEYFEQGATIEELVGALGEDARMGGYIPNLDFYEHGYSSEDGSSEGTAPRIRQRDRRTRAQLHQLRVNPEGEPPFESFVDDIDDTDEDSEDEEVGSMDGFVVNDIEDGPHSVTSSPRSLQWETDEGTDYEGNQWQNFESDRNSQDEDGSVRNQTSFAAAQHDPEDESDEGPILRSRRQVRRRSVASNQSSGSGGSHVSRALNTHRVRNRYNGGRVSANAQQNIPHRNPDASGERSTDGPIAIESDSDSPVSAQHTRRRRALPNRLSSDDDSGVEASIGTATVGRDSPGQVAGWIARRNGGIPSASHNSNASSPILIESSPMRSVNHEVPVPGAAPPRRSAMPPTSLYPNHSQEVERRAPTRANRGADSSSQGMSTRRSSANGSPSNGLQQRRGTRRRSPVPPRAQPHSPVTRESRSPTAMEMFEQGRRDRQNRKIERRAERRRLKAEREQRARP